MWLFGNQKLKSLLRIIYYSVQKQPTILRHNFIVNRVILIIFLDLAVNFQLSFCVLYHLFLNSCKGILYFNSTQTGHLVKENEIYFIMGFHVILLILKIKFN